MKDDKLGLIYGVSAFVLWGLIVIFYKFFDDVSPYEIVAHRIIWSVVTIFLLLAILGRVSKACEIFKEPRTCVWLFLSGWLVSGSWLLFVYAVDQNMIVEAGMGNFICPLISVALGFFILKERLDTGAKFGIFIVFVAILVQVIAVGSLPILAITLALVVSFYGLIRKQVSVPALEGLFVETLMSLPAALVYFLYLLASGQSAFKPDLNGFLLVMCGPITALPLLLFTAAARRVKLSTLGYIQYINPTISMALAVWLYGEKLPEYKIVSFCLIWLALLIVSLQNLARKRVKR